MIVCQSVVRSGTALAAALAFCGGAAFGQTFVKPGDSDVINWTISNDGESVSAAAVSVSVKVTPAELASHFIVDQANSNLGPASIAQNGQQTFTVKYSIGPNAPDGTSFDVVLLATSTSEGALPTVGTEDAEGNIQSAVVSFTIQSSPVPSGPPLLTAFDFGGRSIETFIDGSVQSAASMPDGGVAALTEEHVVDQSLPLWCGFNPYGCRGGIGVLASAGGCPEACVNVTFGLDYYWCRDLSSEVVQPIGGECPASAYAQTFHMNPGDWNVSLNETYITRLTRFRPDGSKAWSVSLGEDFDAWEADVAADGQGNVYLENSRGGTLEKRAADTGALAASIPQRFDNMAMDRARGLLYVVDYDGVSAYDTDLNLQARREIPLIQLALDAAGSVFLASDDGSSTAHEVRKFSAGLREELWTARQDYSAGSWDWGLAGIAATGDGGVLLLPANQDLSAGPLRMYRAADGESVTIEHSYDGPEPPYFDGISGDGRGNVFLTGEGTIGFVVALLDAQGGPRWSPAWWENQRLAAYVGYAFQADERGMLMGAISDEYACATYYGVMTCGDQPYLARFDVPGAVPAPMPASSTDGMATLTSNASGAGVAAVPPSTQAGAIAVASAAGMVQYGSLYDVSPDGAVFSPPAQLQITFDPVGLDIDTTTLALYTFNGVSWDSAPIINQWVTVLSAHEVRVTGSLLHASLYGLFSAPSATDRQPPSVALAFPSSQARGVEAAVGGVVEVRGAASDESAVTWTLAAGSDTLASGSEAVSGALASWDTAGLSGYQTLTLSAVDACGNAASTSAVVFVGDPVFTFAMGRKDSDVIVSKVKSPTGIAARPDGLLWVAKTDEDGLLLLSPAGAVLAEVGGERGREHGHGHERGHGRGDDDDEDEEDDDAGLRLKEPQGLALDAAGALYVADKGNDRVLKLSPDGATILLALGKTDKHGKPKGGSGSGELKKPADVAVDGNGDIYVADGGNRRVSVFDSSGTFLRALGEGVFLSTCELRGIALTTEGVWVADKELSLIYLLSREGALLKSVDDADSSVDEVSRARGVANDPSGNVYVVEPNRDRVQKFGPGGRGMLAFGSKAGLSHADKKAKRYLTEPVDAALAPDGSLWVTDTERDRLVRYALPDGATLLAAGAAGSPAAEPARRLVDHKDGAKVERDDGTGVDVPQGALAADVEVTVDKADEAKDSEEKAAKRRDKKVKPASEEVEYGPEGTRFAKPVTLTLAYEPAPGLDEKSLKVHYWNPLTKDWEALGSVVDETAMTVSAQTTHFSVYQVQGSGSGIAVAAAVDEFGLRDQYAFPNPSRNGSAVTFRVQPGLADSVEVRVYDLSGRKVHSSSDFRLRASFDDGNGKGAQHTYDHAWDVSGAGSGVYHYVITAKKSGQGDIVARGKAAVVR